MARDALTVVFTLGVLDGDGSRLLAVAGGLVLLRAALNLRHNRKRRSEWLLAMRAAKRAEALPVRSGGLSLIRSFTLAVAPSPADFALIWLAASLVPVEVVAALLIVWTPYARMAARIAWTRRWEAESAERLLRESRDPFEGDRRTFTAPRR
jgi:hypothetical protein